MLYRFDECELDDRLHQLRRKGERIEIEPKAFDLLVYLLHRREQVVAKDELLDKLWPGTVVSEAALTRCIARAREAVGDDGEQQRIIKTQHGRGYRFVTAVIEHPLEPETAPTATERALSPPSSRPTPSGCPSTIPAAGVAQQDATREWPAPVVVAISGTVQYLSLRLPAPSASRSSPTTARRVWRRPA